MTEQGCVHVSNYVKVYVQMDMQMYMQMYIQCICKVTALQHRQVVLVMVMVEGHTCW